MAPPRSLPLLARMSAQRNLNPLARGRAPSTPAEADPPATRLARARARHTLDAIRQSRFHTGLSCPRCGNRAVQRWGHFGLRQRYRCRRCARTFSDLTETPFAYGKRPDLWLPFATCMLEALSVRATARQLGIHKDTAWRWRHRVLAAHGLLPPYPLRGTLELVERRFGLCEKGRRDLGRPPLRRPESCFGTGRPSVSVLFLRDEGGTTFAAPADMSPLRRAAVAELLGPRTRHVTAFVGTHAPLHCIAAFAYARGLAYRRTSLFDLHDDRTVSPPLPHALGDALRFRQWVRRFHGVATHYLARYLRWHQVLAHGVDPRLEVLLQIARAPRAVQDTHAILG